MSKACYMALGCAVVLALSGAVSCGREGQSVSTATPRVSITVAPLEPTPAVRRASTATPEASATVPSLEATPMPILEAGALWDWIAGNSPEVEPVLRPTYLPSSLTQVRPSVLGQERGCVVFGIEYSDSAGKAKLLIGGGPWYNLPLPGPDAVQERLNVRQTTGTYHLQDAAEPLGQAFLFWQEPGTWGRPGDDWHRDYVEYLISAEGFPKEELLKVATSLQPVTQ